MTLTQRHIRALLNDLPPESLTVVEEFIQFLREQARQGRPVVTTSAPPLPPIVTQQYRYQPQPSTA